MTKEAYVIVYTGNGYQQVFHFTSYVKASGAHDRLATTGPVSLVLYVTSDDGSEMKPIKSL